MATSADFFATGTPTTSQTSGSWATPANAAGANNGNFAVWTSAAANVTGTINLAYGNVGAAIPAGSTIDLVTVGIWSTVSNAARFSTITAQLMDGGVPFGGIDGVKTSTANNLEDVTFTGVTLAQLANLGVRVIATRANNTQSSTFNLDAVRVKVNYTPPPPAVSQTSFGFFADGPEASATPLGATSANITVNVASGDVPIQLRIRLQEDNVAAPDAGDDWQLQWDKSDGIWNDVQSGGVGILGYNSANLTDNAAITIFRAGPGTGTAVAGRVCEDGLVSDFGWVRAGWTEHLFSIAVNQTFFVNNDVVRFRVVRNGSTAVMTYPQVPAITVTGVPAGPPKTSSLIDTFDTLDTGKWIPYGTVSIQSSQLAATTLQANYSGVATVATYDLNASSVFLKMTPPAGAATRETALNCHTTTNVSGCGFIVNNTTRSLLMRVRQSSVNSDTSITYDPVDHAWVRVRLVGTSMFWDTSPDGLTWTQRRTVTVADTSVFRALQVELSCGQYGTEATTPIGYFDSLNFLGFDFTGTATLSGSGTLSTVRTPAVSGTPALSGGGTLTAGTTPRPTVAPALSGTGTLSAIGAPSEAHADSAALSGTGTLSAATTPKAVGTAALSGGGSLSAGVAPKVTAAPALSGSGSLSATVKPTATATPALSGSGTLSAAATPATGTAAALSGSGTLVAVPSTGAATTAALSGDGTLSATVAPKAAAAAALSGGGILSAATQPTIAAAPVLSGSGTLSATVAPKASTAVALSGAGSLVAVPSTGAATPAALSGDGVLSVAALPKASAVVALSGSGALVVAAVPKPAGLATLSGSGSLGTVTRLTVLGVVALSGSGTLSAVGSAAEQGAAFPALSGAGVLAVTSTPRVSGIPVLSGAGILSVVTVTAGGSAVALTGSGLLVAGAAAGGSVPAALSGSGTLIAKGHGRLLVAVALTGGGTLTATAEGVQEALALLTGMGRLVVLDSATLAGVATLGAEGSLSALGFVGAAGESAEHPGVSVPDTPQRVLVAPSGGWVVVAESPQRVSIPESPQRVLVSDAAQRVLVGPNGGRVAVAKSSQRAVTAHPYAGSVRVHASGGTVHVEDT